MKQSGRWVVGEANGRFIIVLDSISYIQPTDAGQILLSASHGGMAAANYALAYPPHFVLFNDAGVGKDAAGIVALPFLAQTQIAAAAVSHHSARIGDGWDTWQAGVITHLNEPARALGVIPNELVRTLIQRWQAAE